MKIGCCISIDYYDALAQAGYETITLAAKDIANMNDDALRKTQAKLEAGPLRRYSLNSFCTPEIQLHGTEFSPKKVADYMELVSKRAALLGFKYIGIGAPESRNLRAGENLNTAMAQFRQAVTILCDVAADFSLDVLMESVCSSECNFITTTHEMLAFNRTVGRDNLHLVYDIYHEYMENQTLSVIKEAADEIKVVHIAQNEDGRCAYLRKENLEEYRAYWKALLDIGFTGEWNLEAFAGAPSIELEKTMQIMNEVMKTQKSLYR